MRSFLQVEPQRWCRAPEHGFPGHKRPNQDIWSVGILVVELAAGRALYDASVKNREILKIYGDGGHDLHPRNLHRTMPELQGMSDAFHDFLDEVTVLLRDSKGIHMGWLVTVRRCSKARRSVRLQ